MKNWKIGHPGLGCHFNDVISTHPLSAVGCNCCCHSQEGFPTLAIKSIFQARREKPSGRKGNPNWDILLCFQKLYNKFDFISLTSNESLGCLILSKTITILFYYADHIATPKLWGFCKEKGMDIDKAISSVPQDTRRVWYNRYILL